MWMIYGATGYTGKLIAETCAKRGLRPVLAGRSDETRRLAESLGLESRVFPLEEAANGIAGMKAVLHCAGPFSRTSRTMLDACLRARASYLDITGEIDVFEAVHARSAEIAAAGVAAIPGVGFDVVPTDCLASMLKTKLPGATRLELAFRSTGRSSRGTTRTMIEGMGNPSKVRRGGKITAITHASVAREVEFREGRSEHAVAIPWGDVSTAFHSTGIPDITVYVPLPRSRVPALRALAFYGRSALVRKLLTRLADRFVRGPSAEELKTGRCLLFGEVTDAGGRVERLRLETPDGYQLTVDAAIAAVERVVQENLRGALTPSRAFGAEFALSLPGVRLL
jgi:saccharopine dehydrogenase (NAD+, L-lysine-forming)